MFPQHNNTQNQGKKFSKVYIKFVFMNLKKSANCDKTALPAKAMILSYTTTQYIYIVNLHINIY